MRAIIFIEENGQKQVLASVKDLEVVPRGIYEVDGVEYQYTGQPKFIIYKDEYEHKLASVEFTVERVHPIAQR